MALYSANAANYGTAMCAAELLRKLWYYLAKLSVCVSISFVRPAKVSEVFNLINKKNDDNSSSNLGTNDILSTVTDTISKAISDLQTAIQTTITSLLIGPQNQEQPMAMDDQSSPRPFIVMNCQNDQSTNVAIPTGEDSRKFNAVIYGIPECNTSTTRFERLKQDFCKVFDVCSAIVPSNNPSSVIHDTMHLGKYSSDSARPRPVLVKFNSAGYASNLLSNKKQCPKGITVKPDLPLQARKIESLLLKERWQFIQKGQDRKAIRILKRKQHFSGW